jgi:hypothetical protein
MYINSNFPRIETVFDCIGKPTQIGPPVVNDLKYPKLIDLKEASG